MSSTQHGTTGRDCEARLPPPPPPPRLYHVRPKDGRLVPLIVQSLQDERSLPPARGWLRLGARPPSLATTLGRVSYWIAGPVMEEGGTGARAERGAWTGAVVRMVVSLPLTAFLFYGLEFMSAPFQTGLETSGMQVVPADHRYQPVRHMGGSDRLGADDAPVQRRAYTDDIDLDANFAASEQEGDDDTRTVMLETSDQGAASRPRYLCYVRDFEQRIFETIHVSRFLEEEGDDVDMEFVFVSYTREQFRVATDEEIDAYPDYPDEPTREANRTLARRDREVLVQWGVDAARRAGKRAFWIDFECVRDKDGVARTSSKSDDVYRICDVVRGAHSMIIAISPPAAEKVAAIMDGRDGHDVAAGAQSTTRWLRHWGSRLWTLPELLLCPSEHRVQLYVLGQRGEEPLALAKRNFAERAWDDAELVKELVNHYEGSAILSQLQLVETALECFARRGTHQFSQGDVAYALMGLLPISQRPAVCPGDTGFQAFARLSLANDGGEFLSRMACLWPPEGRDGGGAATTPWYDHVKDVWGARIRDVHPDSRVLRVASDGAPDTLVVDGAHGAAVRWDGFDAAAARQAGMPRSTALVAALIWSGCFSISLVLLLLLFEHMAARDGGQTAWPAFLRWALAICGPLLVLPAVLMPVLYLASQGSARRGGGKADLVGLEGHVDAGSVERHLWGFDHGRLTTVDAGDGVYQDTNQDDAATGGEQARGEKTRFTIVDTHLLTVTHIRAHKPPVAYLVLGGEGGKRRALLCSYDARDDAFEREAVLRVPPAMEEQMRRMNQFRLRLRSREMEGGSWEGPRVEEEGVSGRKMEGLFATIVFLALDMFWPLTFSTSRNDAARLSRTVYGGVFIACLVPAWFLMHRISFVRMIPQLTILRAISPAFVDILPPSPTKAILSGLLYGALDASSLPVLVALCWSWWGTSPSRLAARLVVFSGCIFILPALGRDALRRRVEEGGGSRGSGERMAAVLYLVHVVELAMCVGVATVGRHRVGRPEEVGWVQAGVKRRLLLLRGEVDSSKTLRERLVVPLVISAVALTSHLGVDGSVGTTSIAHAVWLGILLAAIAALCTILRGTRTIVFALAGVIFIAAAGSAYSSLTKHFSLVARVLAGARVAILPLLWALADACLDSWTEKTQTLCLSLVGMATGILLKQVGEVMDSYKVQIPMAVAAMNLLAGLVVYLRTERRGRIALT